MKICFVGTGSIGKRHIRNVWNVAKERGMDIELHALRSSRSDLEKDIQLLVKKQAYSYEELDDFYDAVYIANPTNLHYETILQLQDKCNNFFIEKPVFNKTNQDISQIKQHKDMLMYVACPLRYTQVLDEARKVIKTEHVISAKAISSSYLPDWRPNTDYRKVYSAHKNQGGGVVIDLIHEWDYLISLFGFPAKVHMLAGKYSDLEIDSEDLAIYIAAYGDKLLELHLDYFGRETQRYLELFTTMNHYLFDIAGSRVIKNGTTIFSFEEDGNRKYIEETKHFFHLIEHKEENTNSLEHALKTMRIAYGEEGTW